ncbi:olfactory receptor 6F1-like [Pleurodeles waltl]|uniref:olfactory receptor 6F1-like n=1 Tax=Pleurodeles waltl TaxID=8319 RepID=UPI0037096246
MKNTNKTEIREFILLSLGDTSVIRIAFFLIFLGIYVLTVIGNVLIIVLIGSSPNLQTPMYFFLIHLATLEIFYVSVTVPKLLENFISEERSISFAGCITQLFFFGFLGSTECFLLALMAVDRYFAICLPLRYHTIMNNRMCFQLVIASWACGFLSTLLSISLISSLQFCGFNRIQHFFCDISPLLQLACADPRNAETVIFLVASFILLSSSLVTILSYIWIIATIVKIPSSSGRKKAFSTCASHLSVVVIYYGTMIFVYVRPTTSQSIDFTKVISVLYTVVTPLLNPFIYTLRNKEVKQALMKCISRYCLLSTTL